MTSTSSPANPPPANPTAASPPAPSSLPASPAPANLPPHPAKPGFRRRVGQRFATIGQLFAAVWGGPFWWLVPFVCVLVVFAFLLVIIAAFPGAAPFVYALF